MYNAIKAKFSKLMTVIHHLWQYPRESDELQIMAPRLCPIGASSKLWPRSSIEETVEFQDSFKGIRRSQLREVESFRKKRSNATLKECIGTLAL